MKVILLETIKDKGKKDQIIEVASGYGNFLIKQKKALIANDENLNSLDKKLASQKELHEKNVVEAIKLKEQLDRSALIFLAKVSPRGTITKKITSRDIANRLNQTFNINIDKHKVVLNTDLNTLGVYEVNIKLYDSILATLKVIIKEL